MGQEIHIIPLGLSFELARVFEVLVIDKKSKCNFTFNKFCRRPLILVKSRNVILYVYMIISFSAVMALPHFLHLI